MYHLSAWLLLALLRDVSALWPQPQSLSTGSTPLRLSTSFTVKYAFNKVPGDLKDAVTRTKGFLTNDNLELLVPDRGSSHSSAIKKAKQLQTLTLSLTGKGPIQSISEEAILDLTERQESYNLTVPADGSGATLSAPSTLGLLRGLTTFSQLWFSLSDTTYTLEAPIRVEDEPAYPYRGFMLDTARNFSELSTAGAYNPPSVYTESDIKNIVSYAAARGIDVMVEIDTPGHTSVIGDSHPDYVACKDLEPWSQFANEPPAGQLRFTDKAVISFVQSLFKSTASLFPSKLFSTGGDEINMNCYDQDNATQQDLATSGKTFEEALSTFTQQTHSVLENAGKTPVVWEEMVLAHNVTLSPKTIALVWISSQDVSAVTQKGFRVVHAASDFFYLDCGGGGWVGDNVDGNSWCDPFKTWQKAYSFDPLANISESQQHLILGGEQLLWTEQSGPENLDPIVWPRAAASAEVFWTGGTRNVSEALPRLHEFRYRLVQRGVNAINLQPQWCALRPHACDLPFISKIVIPKNEENQIDTKLRDNEAEEQHDESFPVYLQNHVRKRIEDFFGFSPWPYGMHMTNDKTVRSERALKHQVQNHDDEEVVPENSEKQKSNLKPDEEQESFGVFIQNHVKKRMGDYFGPIIPKRQEEEL